MQIIYLNLGLNSFIGIVNNTFICLHRLKLSLSPPPRQDMTYFNLETVQASKILAKVGKSKSPKMRLRR